LSQIKILYKILVSQIKVLINLFLLKLDHKLQCRCLDNYFGNPEVLCSPPEEPKIGCRAVTECPKSESCINERCVNPCNCGQNADCFVKNHIPTCQCKSGFAGDPFIGCVKVGCERNSECANDKICHNRECINPCIIADQCPVSAICYGDEHIASKLLIEEIFNLFFFFL
jgi:hypothetical protein